ncbi:MAG: DUF1806 family protein [Bacillota bacterium]
MQPIDPQVVSAALAAWAGRTAYVHQETVPGGFIRNVRVDIEQAVLRGDQPPYRVALRCRGDAWVVTEGLTHMDLTEGQPLFLCALEGDQRLSRALQLSVEPFRP